MSDGDNDNLKNIVNLDDWRVKHRKSSPKPIWVSDANPKMIVKLDHSDLSVQFIGYDNAHKKVYYKNLSLIEITSLFKSIQDEYTKYQK